ncbi:Uncharacterised protein [Sphingobacterium mizutaii]|uniref:Uncharacterized protein n=1 Tax=Sphingobacterium mizutaii TaxID=1010 RepID=A0AAJ5C0J3_9SPHI|nr:hypothetical protein SAMN05192578_1011256 [Sphingobacterium mizutaii]SNV51390.1 Uncharacterised protein [Sphingobacterium mizutaii]
MITKSGLLAAFFYTSITYVIKLRFFCAEIHLKHLVEMRTF